MASLAFSYTVQTSSTIRSTKLYPTRNLRQLTDPCSMCPLKWQTFLPHYQPFHCTNSIMVIITSKVCTRYTVLHVFPAVFCMLLLPVVKCFHLFNLTVQRKLTAVPLTEWTHNSQVFVTIRHLRNLTSQMKHLLKDVHDSRYPHLSNED